MNQYLAPDPTLIKKPSRVRWIVEALLIVVIITTLFYIYQNFRTEPPLVAETNVTPTGAIFITYTPKDSVVPRLFSYNLETKQTSLVENAEYIYASAEAPNGNIASSYNQPDGSSFIMMSTVVSEAEERITPQILGTVHQLSWSTDGKYLAFEVAQRKLDIAKPDEVYIVVLDTQTKEQVIVAQGISPAFYDATTLLYLKNNGVYQTSAQVAASPETLPNQVYAYTSYESTIDSRIAFFPDRTGLFVAHPAVQVLESYGIKQENGLTVTDNVQFTETVFSPVVSADAQALLFLSTDTPSTEKGSELTVIDFKTGKKEIVGSITADTTKAIFISNVQ